MTQEKSENSKSSVAPKEVPVTVTANHLEYRDGDPAPPPSEHARLKPSEAALKDPLGIVVRRGLPIQGKDDSDNDKAIEQAKPQLISFVDPDRVELVFGALDWSIDNEIKLLITIANKEDIAAKTRMAAAKALHDLAIKALILRGDIVTARATETRTFEDGTILTVEKMATVVKQTQQNTLLRKQEITSDVKDKSENQQGEDGDSGSSPRATIHGSFHVEPTATTAVGDRNAGLASGSDPPTEDGGDSAKSTGDSGTGKDGGADGETEGSSH